MLVTQRDWLVKNPSCKKHLYLQSYKWLCSFYNIVSQLVHWDYPNGNGKSKSKETSKEKYYEIETRQFQSTRGQKYKVR